MTELWVDLIGYENLYKISSSGKVFGLKKNKLLKGHIRDKYHAITLTKDGVSIIFSTHRLVAQHFIDNPNNYKEVNHKDENKFNNYYENLEWCNRTYNRNYGSVNKRLQISQGFKIEQLQNNIVIAKFESINQTKEFGYTPQAVSECCRGKRPRHKHSEWRIINDNN